MAGCKGLDMECARTQGPMRFGVGTGHDSARRMPDGVRWLQMDSEGIDAVTELPNMVSKEASGSVRMARCGVRRVVVVSWEMVSEMGGYKGSMQCQTGSMQCQMGAMQCEAAPWECLNGLI